MSQRLHIKYGGRAFKFDLIVNTNEDPNVIAQRLRKAAGGKKHNACVIMVVNVEKVELESLFKIVNDGFDKQQGGN